jgi:hypothetical protein
MGENVDAGAIGDIAPHRWIGRCSRCKYSAVAIRIMTIHWKV